MLRKKLLQLINFRWCSCDNKQVEKSIESDSYSLQMVCCERERDRFPNNNSQNDKKNIAQQHSIRCHWLSHTISLLYICRVANGKNNGNVCLFIKTKRSKRVQMHGCVALSTMLLSASFVYTTEQQHERAESDAVTYTCVKCACARHKDADAENAALDIDRSHFSV